MKDWTDEEVLAAWKRGELTVRTGRIIHGDATAEAWKKSYAPDPKPTPKKKGKKK